MYDSEHFALRGEVAGEFDLGGMRHRILFGADYDTFENDQDFRRFRPPAVSGNPSDLAANIINIVNPVYGRFALPTPAPLTNRVDIQQSTGFYVQDQINLSDRLQVRVGARYDDFQLTTDNRITNVASKRKASRLSPQAGLVFETSDSVSLYAVYGEGFRANIGTDASGRIFDPETSRSIEAGAKLSLLDGKLTGTLSLYEMTKSNVLATDTTNPGFLVAIGKARSRGAELDIAGQITPSLGILFSYAYTDAESRSSILDPNFSFQIRPGDPLINIPKHSVNMQLTQDFNVGGLEGKIGAGVQHVGERSGETGTNLKLPSHVLVRAFGNVALTKGVELFGEVRNLFNAHWYANSYSALWVQPGTPRAASIGVRTHF
jgi:iron complex outermembrane receptor protein